MISRALWQILHLLSGVLQINFIRHLICNINIRYKILFDDEIFDHLSLLRSD